MKVSFAPLSFNHAAALSQYTGIDFMHSDFEDEDRWFCCSVADGDRLGAVIVFEFKTWFDAHVSLVVFDPKALSRKLISTLVTAVFRRAKRISALVDANNMRALRQVWRLGFKHEGFIRLGIEGQRDAVMFGMLPDDCPYLKGEPFRFKVITPTHEAPHGLVS